MRNKSAAAKMESGKNKLGSALQAYRRFEMDVVTG
jgi:hypothetical protein